MNIFKTIQSAIKNRLNRIPKEAKEDRPKRTLNPFKAISNAIENKRAVKRQTQEMFDKAFSYMMNPPIDDKTPDKRIISTTPIKRPSTEFESNLTANNASQGIKEVKPILPSLTKEEIQKTESLKELIEYKEGLKPLIEEANSRWKILEYEHMDSPAIQNAMEEAPIDEYGDKEKYFDISSLNDLDSVMKEAYRARNFLLDKTSTIEGVEEFENELRAIQHKGDFGNQWRTLNNGKTYAPHLDENVLKQAFKAYRMLDEIYDAGIQEYGSDKVISYLYDTIEKSGIAYMENGKDYLHDIVMEGYEFLSEKTGYKKVHYDEEFSRYNGVAYLYEYHDYKRSRKKRGL